MTFCDKIRAAMLDEYRDVVKYHCLAVTASDAVKPILRDIAGEEWIHAEHLREVLLDLGGTLNDAEKVAHDEAHNAMGKNNRKED